MRCLYCGKELALLKRWTSGGEFCSDAHRQQYQDEYNQLALNRLLQAKPPGENNLKAGEPQPVAVPIPEITPVQHAAPESHASWAIAQPPPPADVHFEDRREDEPSSWEGRREDRAPAEAVGFLVETPVPAAESGIAPTPPELDFENAPTPALPSATFGAPEMRLPVAGRLTFEPCEQAQENPVRRKERKLELREFGRGAPLVEMDLWAAHEVGQLETSENAMDILILPQAPEGSPPVWMAPEQGFMFETELGDLARAKFPATGFGDNEEETQSPLAPAVEASTSVEPRAANLSAPPVMVEPVAFSREDSTHAAPSETEVRRPQMPFEPQQPAASVYAESTRFEQHEPEPAPELEQEQEQEQEQEREQEPELVAVASSPTQRVPGVVTKPLPLTLHGLAAGRGKAVQIFQSAVSTGVDIQVPRATGLPLRAVMILGPAESIKTVEEKPVVSIKPDAKRQPPRPEPRFSNGKNRKPEVRIEPERKELERKEPERKEPEKKIAAVAVEERPVPTIEMPPKPPEKKPAAPAPFENRPAAYEESTKSQGSLPAPLSAPYNPPDLGLPSLNLQAGDSFFSRLPVAGKIAAAAVVALIVAGGMYFMTKGGGGASANVGPHVMEAGPALPSGDSGWITDWGAETGVKKQHEISVLRPSMNLTDYRIEFQAQIETKALGWVYRAKDPKNYYATRIEIVKPGLEPTVALVRFAVINGEEQPHAQFPLSLAVRIDTLYKIRFEAVGDQFTTWVQDQKVDEWTDDRIKTGGVGLYNLWGERMSLKGGVNVVPLVMKK